MLYWLTALSAGLFFVVIILGVLARYVTQSPLLWSIEIARLLFVWSCFLAAALAYRKKAHIAIGLLVDKFSPNWQMQLEVIRQVMVIFFMLLIFYASSETIFRLWFSKLPVLGISQAWFYIPVPLSALSIISFSFEAMLRSTSTAKPA
ncbi:MAG: TRAP transporter small permease [Bacteroidota bacterium]